MRTITQKILAGTAIIASTFVFLAPAWGAEGTSKTLPDLRRAETRAEQAPSLGILIGMANTEDNYKGAATYAVEMGFQPWIPFGAAVEAGVYSSGRDNNQPGLTRTKLLLKSNYNFGGDTPVLRDMYVGLGLGPVWDNVANRSVFQLGIAPQLGFDIPLNHFAPGFSLGANASYLFVSGAQPDVFAVNGVAKYWF